MFDQIRFQMRCMQYFQLLCLLSVVSSMTLTYWKKMHQLSQKMFHILDIFSSWYHFTWFPFPLFLIYRNWCLEILFNLDLTFCVRIYHGWCCELIFHHIKGRICLVFPLNDLKKNLQVEVMKANFKFSHCSSSLFTN